MQMAAAAQEVKAWVSHHFRSKGRSQTRESHFLSSSPAVSHTRTLVYQSNVERCTDLRESWYEKMLRAIRENLLYGQSQRKNQQILISMAAKANPQEHALPLNTHVPQAPPLNQSCSTGPIP